MSRTYYSRAQQNMKSNLANAKIAHEKKTERGTVLFEAGRTEVTIHTDGSGTVWGNPCGWAAILISGAHRTEVSCGEPDGTNNTAELGGPIYALGMLRKPSNVTLWCDSEYIVLGINHRVAKWSLRNFNRSRLELPGKEIPNANHWRALFEAMKPHRVFARWVKGHSKAPADALPDTVRAYVENHKCDKMAGAARQWVIDNPGAPIEVMRRTVPNLFL